ncbi:hypothetical protein [Brevibacillus daliensis]|uniref:hypothetical protein n=1 Tax=Brevibacillus daliensis TaxID=2892995 RepID=UPI001E3AFFF7|nr:hypothetical protein [Brevibacillus daliensis]
MAVSQGNKKRLQTFYFIGGLLLTALLAFMGGMWGASAKVFDSAPAGAYGTAWDWAIAKELVKKGDEQKQMVTQAEFLKMVVEIGKVPTAEGPVPTEVEDHWASSIYATAKANGVIDCSCQIKPDGELTEREAAKFVMLALNGKWNKPIITLEAVEGWVAENGSGVNLQADQNQLTKEQAMELVYRMDRLLNELTPV